MTEKEKNRRREYARKWYAEHKDDPEFKAKRKAYRDKYYSCSSEVKKAQQRLYYQTKIKGKRKEYYQSYYQAHKEKMNKYSKAYREKNVEKCKAYQRKYNKKKSQEAAERRKAKKLAEQTKAIPSANKIATIFKNPAAAEHYKWLMQKRGVIKTESEVEHEVAN